jgi:hypothetical protein
MKSSRTVKTLGLAAALLVPAIAIASFNIPHTFVSNEVLTANDLRGNFDAVAAQITTLQNRLDAVEALQAKVTALETTTNNLSATTGGLTSTTNSLTTTTNKLSGHTDVLDKVALNQCLRFYTGPCPAGSGDECVVKCPANWFAVSGGCDAQASSAITQNAPSLRAGVPFPPNGNNIPPTSFDGWVCQAQANGTGPNTGVMQTAHVLCCPWHDPVP